MSDKAHSVAGLHPGLPHSCLYRHHRGCGYTRHEREIAFHVEGFDRGPHAPFLGSREVDINLRLSRSSDIALDSNRGFSGRYSTDPSSDVCRPRERTALTVCRGGHLNEMGARSPHHRLSGFTHAPLVERCNRVNPRECHRKESQHPIAWHLPRSYPRPFLFGAVVGIVAQRVPQAACLIRQLLHPQHQRRQRLGGEMAEGLCERVSRGDLNARQRLSSGGQSLSALSEIGSQGEHMVFGHPDSSWWTHPEFIAHKCSARSDAAPSFSAQSSSFRAMT